MSAHMGTGSWQWRFIWSSQPSDHQKQVIKKMKLQGGFCQHFLCLTVCLCPIHTVLGFQATVHLLTQILLEDVDPENIESLQLSFCSYMTLNFCLLLSWCHWGLFGCGLWVAIWKEQYHMQHMHIQWCSSFSRGRGECQDSWLTIWICIPLCINLHVDFISLWFQVCKMKWINAIYCNCFLRH